MKNKLFFIGMDNFPAAYIFFCFESRIKISHPDHAGFLFSSKPDDIYASLFFKKSIYHNFNFIMLSAVFIFSYPAHV